jgi:Na+-translocating ferredoxin:NAD+ oxidoreductase RNF subunit RnfB
MQELTTAIALMTGLTLVLGVLLAVAGRTLRVDEDPRLRDVENLLGGSNCGACGRPGCHAFAESLLRKESAPSECTVIAPEVTAQIAELLGVDVGNAHKRVARLHCAGGVSAVRMLGEYRGERSCAAAAVVQHGGRSCSYGCLGFGDCVAVCTFSALHLNDELLPVVDVDRCTACGDCVSACPANLFTLEDLEHDVVVQCSSPLVGEAARASCAVACDACGRCALDAPPGVIVMRDGLPVVERPGQVPEHATYRCPTGAIALVESRQFEIDVPVSALRRHHE